MRTPEEIQAMHDKIAELETQKNALPLELEEFKRQLDLRKQVINAELKTLKRKIAWQKFSQQHYTPADHSQDIAVQMFGKRLKDLSPEEKKAYNRIRTQQSRARRRKQNDLYTRIYQ